MWQAVLVITPTTVVLFLLGALALALGLALWAVRAPHRRAPRTTAQVLLAVWLLLMLVVTLAPVQPVGSGDATFWWRPGEGLFELGAQLEPGQVALLVRRQIAGTALFVPVPLLLRFASPRWSAAGAFLLGVGLSVAIEAGQLLMRAGRVADIDDVLCAAAGTVTGAALALLAKTAAAVLHRRALPRRAVRAAAAPAPEEA
ncbi:MULTISPECIES: VanZ family protein [unclassified Streptomyces]|uniref:VanZ family protein n=1 Tax=unclassified Streptomyces TaxID=2593676 RepID=UPI000C27EC86|nr:VanZ family protein [Streptomyces sp. CB02959]PJN36888.1 VanZ family protein [Streptomyces sp. CB02959]